MAKPLLITFGLAVDPPSGRARKDYWKDLKDFIRPFIDEQPDWTEFTTDPTIATTEFKTFRHAFQAFDGMNGCQWNGTILSAILCYPDGRWLVHPSTDAENAKPLIYAAQKRNAAWLQRSFHSPGGSSGRQRNLSFSSNSSQASSTGGFSPPPGFAALTGQRAAQIAAQVRARIRATLRSVCVDTRTGDFLGLGTGFAYPPDQQPNRYRTFRYMQGFYPPELSSPTPLPPSYDFIVERRTIIIRELGFNVTEQQLVECLASQHSEGPCTIRRNPDTRRCHAFVEYPSNHQAVEAVRRLNGLRLADRTLSVEIAPEGSIVNRRRHSRSSTLGSLDSDTSSSITAGSPRMNRRHGPIIADGST
ncbi:MAG: hypothetical protein Q9191_004952 [Dirinaria sp. TL-2023a]